MLQNDLRAEMLHDNLWRLLFRLSPIAILSMSINSINTFVDAMFIGHYLGEVAVGAISLAFPLAIVTGAFSAMIGVGASSILSIAIGAEEGETQRKIFGTTVVLALVVSLSLTFLGWTCAEFLIGSMGGKGEMLALGVRYYQHLILGAFFQIFAVATSMLIRAEGNLKEAMVIAIFSTLVNIMLNPVFVGYLEMGIEGAAYATIVSMVCFSVLNFWYFYTERATFEIDFRYYRLEWKIVRPLLGIGISAMMLQLMFVLQQVLVFKSLDIYGTDRDITFMGACYRIMILLIMPGIGFSAAMQPILGISVGAKDYARVRRTFWIFTGSNLLVLVFCWGLTMRYPTTMLGWLLPNMVFTAEDILNFRYLLSLLVLHPFFIMGVKLYQSIGNAKLAGNILILREILFFVPVLWLLPKCYGVTGIYLTPIVQNISVAIVIILLLNRTFRRWTEKEQVLVRP